MALPERRNVLRGLSVALPILATGCLSFISQDPIEIEYRVWSPVTNADNERSFPEIRQEIEVLVTIGILIQSGEIESNDLFRGTQVKVNGSTRSMVGMRVITPSPAGSSGKTITSTEENHSLKEGTRADIYYHIAHDEEQIDWITKDLRSEYDTITIKKRRSS